MWVADMDFRTAPEIIDALKERVEYGIFGYSDTTGEYEDIVVNWAKKHYDIDIEMCIRDRYRNTLIHIQSCF